MKYTLNDQERELAFMKLKIDLGAGVPDTIRISADWRAAFQLSRYSSVLDCVLFQIEEAVSDRDVRFQCSATVKLYSELAFTLQERSVDASTAVFNVIDRVASSVRRIVRRHTRICSNRGFQADA
jgi:hypothetical protein